MFESRETIIPSGVAPQNLNSDQGNGSPLKKIIIIGGLILLLLILVAGALFVLSKFLIKKYNPNILPTEETPATSTQNILPNLNLPATATSTIATTTFSNIAVEYLSFADFYKLPEGKIDIKLNDYSLPLNIKIDVLNYYDLSRKLSLDPVLNDLNTNGFAEIDNPWVKEVTDFYSIYSTLEKKQIPFLITSDFILYYHQTVLKKIFKDIEENIFYDNLWSINKDLYNSAKNRYEARLSAIGNVNDSILEGERLEAAFFAVALELLKPADNQVAPKGTLDDKNKFVTTETERFYFVTPPYLRDDVLKEVKLIRDSKEKVKSPVMLYTRDYADFVVPADYRSNARLNNFYLTTKWLNSVFPLNYRDKNCPNCLLDREDWRLAMIAASFISSDFSDLPELKNKWARIYKVISYFNPLREDLNYVYYRDALKSVFGEAYKIDELFDDKNPEAKNNMVKLQAKLNSLEFSPFLGAIDKKNPDTNYRLGFKMLVETYLPNDYIFTHLTYPVVDSFLGTSTKANNITACYVKSASRRCNGIALDAVNVVYPIAHNDYFTENSSYLNYDKEIINLRTKFNEDAVWHTTNYWASLSSISAYLNTPSVNLPLFSQTLAWHDRTLTTAVSAWVNMQLPLEKFSVNQLFKGQGFNNFSRFNDNSYVEPNLALIDELLATNLMMQKMFTALQVNQEVVAVPNALILANENLTALRTVVVKELTGLPLEAEDNEIITNFAKQLTINEPINAKKILTLKTPGLKNGLKEDVSRLKLMILIHREGDDKVFSVGPVWDYSESR
ncbi:MAG: DUF3160 domain-containing protein [Candidatus Falkowbacteria bacterium]